jgi:hypothetical protein
MRNADPNKNMVSTIVLSPVVEKPNWVTVEAKYCSVKIRNAAKQNIAPTRLMVLLRGLEVKSESNWA